jgi:hypothetical protein
MSSFQVRNSTRAFIVALIPVAALYGVLTAMAALGSLAPAAAIAVPTPDAAFMSLVLMIAIDATLLFAGHRLLQSLSMAGRLSYALMGGVMTAVGHVLALRYGLYLAPPATGSTITSGVLPVLAGMIAGFLYHQLAGLMAVASPAADADAPLRFGGPVRVRTSLAASSIAALVPAVLTAVLFFTVTYGFISGSHEPSGATWSRQIMALAAPAQMFLITLMITFLPSIIFTLLTHFVARACGCRSIAAYAAIGAGTGLACALLVTPLTPFTSNLYTGGPTIICGAIMGALYRRFAGLEPLPLPEMLQVDDESALVGADHPARVGHAVAPRY